MDKSFLKKLAIPIAVLIAIQIISVVGLLLAIPDLAFNPYLLFALWLFEDTAFCVYANRLVKRGFFGNTILGSSVGVITGLPLAIISFVMFSNNTGIGILIGIMVFLMELFAGIFAGILSGLVMGRAKQEKTGWKHVFNRNFLILTVGLLVLWLSSSYAYLSLFGLFDVLALVIWMSLNMSISLLMTYWLGKGRYALGAEIGTIHEFCFGFLPPSIAWWAIFIGSIVLYPNLGCAGGGGGAFCLFFIPLLLLGPTVALAIAMGLTSVFSGYFFRRKKFSLLAKVGLIVWLLVLISPLFIEIYSLAVRMGSHSGFSFEKGDWYSVAAMAFSLLTMIIIKWDIDRELKGKAKNT